MITSGVSFNLQYGNHEMPSPFTMIGQAFDEFQREALSTEEREAIRARAEERRQKDLEEEFEGMANTMPLMLDKFEKAGVHKKLAKFMFNFYTELKAAGFTDDQAIKITAQNFTIDGEY